MSADSGNQELLQDFLQEAMALVEDVDAKLVELEKRPADKQLLNDIFRGFHTIKGGAGFLNIHEVVSVCHLTESLFDKLRNSELNLSSEILDVILDATAAVRQMFNNLSASKPLSVAPHLLARLEQITNGKTPEVFSVNASSTANNAMPSPQKEVDWNLLYSSLVAVSSATASETGVSETQPFERTPGRRAADNPEANVAKVGRRDADKLAIKESTIRIDTARLDDILNITGEIGLVKNRLNGLRDDIKHGKTYASVFNALDKSLGELSILVGDLQNVVMKSRMLPVSRLFQKYPRMARDLARQLGKEVELAIFGEETELDKTMIEELSDPIMHLIRNAIDHGIETGEQRKATNKPEKATLSLRAMQVGDRITLEVSDDGRGMVPEVLRRKAIEKGLIDAKQASSLDDRQSLQLIFLPGFSTKEQVSNISGRGVGMDVVKTNIQKLNGQIEILSQPGVGTTFSISLPLTLTILPVLIVRFNQQLFAIPLTLVREIVRINPEEVQAVSNRAASVVRDEVLQVRSLGSMLGWTQKKSPSYGVVVQLTMVSLVIGVDSYVSRDEVVVKPLANVRPKGVAGATLSAGGEVVLVLDVEELLDNSIAESRTALFADAA